MKPGVYTLRFALQPQNGDHLGVSPNREFAGVPVGLVTTPDPLGYKGTVWTWRSRRFGDRIRSALSLDPPAATAAPLSPVGSNDLGLSGPCSRCRRPHPVRQASPHVRPHPRGPDPELIPVDGDHRLRRCHHGRKVIGADVALALRAARR